jgi:hypothetical protein
MCAQVGRYEEMRVRAWVGWLGRPSHRGRRLARALIGLGEILRLSLDLLMLHDLCAPSRGEFGLPASR